MNNIATVFYAAAPEPLEPSQTAPVTSAASRSVPFDRRVVAVSGTTWQRLVLGFSGRARPHAIKTSHVLRGRGTAPLRKCSGRRAHRAQDLAWAAGMAHGGTARRGGSCFQRLSPYPVALSCALQLAWASCPKSRFLFFRSFLQYEN